MLPQFRPDGTPSHLDSGGELHSLPERSTLVQAETFRREVQSPARVVGTNSVGDTMSKLRYHLDADQIELIKRGLIAANQGDFASDEEVTAIFRKWGLDDSSLNEAKKPPHPPQSS
jgi:hypothetical protein